MSFFNNNAEIILFAAQIDLEQVKTQFEKLYIVQKYRDAVHIEMPKGHLFIFDYGVLVAWGVNPAKQDHYLTVLKHIAKGVNPAQTDRYEFVKAGKESSQLVIVDNQLSLPNVQVDSLLTLSHAFAQSAKLQHVEILAEHTISNNQYLINTLSQTGKLPLSRKALAKLRGQLLQTRSDIMLHCRVLDTPEFFWDFPVVDHLYLSLSKYLELKPRIELVNLKRQTMHDLYDMLATEQNHKHLSFLGSIVIILIATEIVLFFFK
ncbi:MAG: putative Rmd1/YagE family protein [Bermanella sp.]|jgi:uncharacterized Rmd1/YagE family protein|uniref:RMD1 family protein n=1 Tax=Glaciecola sp. 33A TaxID=2057807 RepID=UPI000C33C81C|nr:RMD1 family protein [Glaciecola sp. 33A]PKI03201.1 hypothetical protein CXF81_03300 [Glaciecola sp. 33A]